ncbi:MAG TPA: hypothetical protein VFN79_03710 [Steroidobacteraceae bacterium]|nr:hypothetical protein [Steroidobacteraceae bacterium]
MRRPVAIILWWGIPIAFGVSTNFLELSVTQTAAIWACAFAWMGTGCALNALRCGRRHCYISGPVLWLGGIAAGLAALGIISGRNALGEVVNGTIAVAALPLLSECIWGVYSKRPHGPRLRG